MDVMRKLHSLLTPVTEPANRSYSGPARPANQNHGTFAETLREAAGWVENSSEVHLPTVSTERTPEVPGATEKAELPATDLPVAEIHIETRDTLEGIIAAEQEKLETEAPIDLDGDSLDIPVSFVPDDVVVALDESDAAGAGAVTAENTPAGPVAPPAAEPPAARQALPPIGVNWAPLATQGSGVAAGHGVNSSYDARVKQLELKHEKYNNPEKYNATLNTEARMFLDAVDRGYVPNTPEGLGTLLGYLGKGSIGPEARPPAIGAYFNQFFANLNSMNV